MDFRNLYQRISEIDSSDAITNECGEMNATPSPAPQPTASMNVNINAQGMDNIESIMQLFKKVNPDMMPVDKQEPVITPVQTLNATKPDVDDNSEPQGMSAILRKLDFEKDGEHEGYDNEPNEIKTSTQDMLNRSGGPNKKGTPSDMPGGVTITGKNPMSGKDDLVQRLTDELKAQLEAYKQ